MVIMGNNLIVIENGQLNTYMLDNRLLWEVGRPSKGNIPDIKLHSTTVSRKHGKFQNMDGIWFYVDYNGKNGTVYNDKKIQTGLKGRVKPVMISDGDVFVFGGGAQAIINPKTIWAMFSTKNYDGEWRMVDSKGCTKLLVTDGEQKVRLEKPEKGKVVESSNGMAIYMGDITYVVGHLNVMGN